MAQLHTMVANARSHRGELHGAADKDIGRDRVSEKPAKGLTPVNVLAVREPQNFGE